MIYVKRNGEETTQKLIGNFLRRVKRSNLVNRGRKTQFFSKAISHLKKKTKAVKTAKFLRNKEVESRTQK